MVNNILSEMAEHAGIETGRAVKDRPVDLSKHKFETDAAGRFVCTWPTDGVRMIAEAPERKRLEFWILLSVQYRTEDAMPRALITKKRLNLRSVSGSAEVVRFLKGQVERDWAGRLEILSNLVDENYSAGEPMVWLPDVTDPGPVAYLADPLLELNEHNILFAAGGSTKSFLALAMCISYAAGKSVVPGVQVLSQGKALYLDWETSEESARRRFTQFAQHQQRVAYKRMQAPLSDVGDELEQLIRAEKFGLVVCDSASMASGGEIMDEASVARFFMTCRSFKTTILTLAHVPKNSERSSPIGSVYWFNQARVVWELSKDQLEGDSIVRLDLVQHKANNDRVHTPFSLELDFSGPQVVYRRADAGAANEEHLPLPSRIQRWLMLEGRKATAVEIAEAMDKPLPHVIRALKAGDGKMFGHDDAKRDRLWWVLIATDNKNYSHGNNGYYHAPSPYGGEGGNGVHSLESDKEKKRQQPKVDTTHIKADREEDAPAW